MKRRTKQISLKLNDEIVARKYDKGKCFYCIENKSSNNETIFKWVDRSEVSSIMLKKYESTKKKRALHMEKFNNHRTNRIFIGNLKAEKEIEDDYDEFENLNVPISLDLLVTGQNQLDKQYLNQYRKCFGVFEHKQFSFNINNVCSDSDFLNWFQTNKEHLDNSYDAHNAGILFLKVGTVENYFCAKKFLELKKNLKNTHLFIKSSPSEIRIGDYDFTFKGWIGLGTKSTRFFYGNKKGNNKDNSDECVYCFLHFYKNKITPNIDSSD